MKRSGSVYLRHIRDLIDRIKTYTMEGELAFKADLRTQDAVLHNLEIIGQCVKDYGIDELIAAHPTIPWAEVAAFRNILAHQYLGVDIDLVWGIIVRDLPALDQQIGRMVESLGEA